MATSNINVRVDSELKEEAEDLFKDLGLNMSTAITMFLNNGIPFEVKRPSLNAETRAALAEYYVMKREKDGYKRYDSFEDFLKEVEDET